MLIKSIELFNFRQFKDKVKIEFACDKEKNVTVVMGDNGTGKTTLAQAFLWVLYGYTDFKEKRVLNKVAQEEALPNDEIITRVDLNIELDGIDYKITRKQLFIKKNTRIQDQQAKLEISYEENLKTQYIKSSDCIYFVKDILPEQLSKFFIFSGERIDNMSLEIQKGRSKEFGDTVRNLVGLNTIMNALNHLGDRGGTTTVLGRYEKKIDDTASVEVLRLNRDIDNLENKIRSIENVLVDLNDEVENYNKKRLELKDEILKFAPQEELKRQYRILEKEIHLLEKEKANTIKRFFNYLNTNGLSYFQLPAFRSCYEELDGVSKVDKGIPNIHANTIQHLIKKGTCICGNKIEAEELKNLADLLEYLPPKSLGTMINSFNKYLHNSSTTSKSFFEMEDATFKRLRTIRKEIEDKLEESSKIYNRMIDLTGLNSLKSEQEHYEKLYREKKNEIDLKNQQVGSLKTQLKNTIAKKEDYITIDESNRKYITYRNYARKLYEKLNKDYEIQEKETRQVLEGKINNIFENILDGGLSLSVDENYNISIKVEDLKDNNENIERSTAQNYSVIFAFIAGIIDMAKEKGANNGVKEFSKAEVYPLIMDAPLSAFDKKRIRNICNTLPKIANQSIFFIKDTDGEVAEEYLERYIGKRYEITRDSYLVSYIKGRE
ncbi:AAA family ATPase [Clostridium paraputrificum]|uniref:AAA family ATPase n=1 Tax=Clostridium paraputrificum TaxID=29363 RepID=UPI00189D8E26|nr:AAA family ATPase [Clostridium paraputrificum]MDB2116844.1 AAA family ATPase [Clostridium paraputrificum]